MIQVNTQVTQQDFIKFNFWHLFSKPSIWILAVIIAIVFSNSFFSLSETGLAGFEEASLFKQLTPLLFLAFMLIFILWGVYRQSRRNYSTTTSLHEPVVYTFSSSGVHMRGSSFESELKWDVYHKVQETKALFILYQNNMAANLVPKAAFESQEQVEAFRTLVSVQKSLKHKLRRD